MNDDELRALIRQAISRHLGNTPGAGLSAPPEPQRDPPASITFGQYRLERTDSMCIVEPSVACNHCGFCKCHGH